MYSRLGMILLQLAKFFTMKVFLHEISSFCKVPAYTYVVDLLFLTSFEQTYLTKFTQDTKQSPNADDMFHNQFDDQAILKI